MPKLEPLFVDTGYVIALINQNDRHHQKALTWANQYAGHPLITTDAVLLEIGNALARVARTEVAEIIRYFQVDEGTTIISLNQDVLTAALLLYSTYQDKTWGLVDCLSFVVMRDMKISTALAFDRHFLQAGFKLPPFQP